MVPIRPQALQETGARNGWRTADRLRKSEPGEGAKTNGTNWSSLMKSQDAGNRSSSVDQGRRTRNPFDVMDVPNPNDQEVLDFATGAKLAGTSEDENAKAWTAPSDRDQYGAIEGNWSSRWNGGADPTIPGDAANKWKQGQAEVKAAGDRLYLLFDWDNGARRGLIDAHRESARLSREVYQSDRSKGHAPLDRLDREQSKDRRALDRGTSGFPSIR
jgi:hypothetical protein